jgi:hypothetical protein
MRQDIKDVRHEVQEGRQETQALRQEVQEVRQESCDGIRGTNKRMDSRFALLMTMMIALTGVLLAAIKL